MMFRYYHVYLVNESGKAIKYIETVKCLSESTAEQQTYNRYGSASKYSGWGRENFKAVEA